MSNQSNSGTFFTSTSIIKDGVEITKDEMWAYVAHHADRNAALSFDRAIDIANDRTDEHHSTSIFDDIRSLIHVAKRGAA